LAKVGHLCFAGANIMVTRQFINMILCFDIFFYIAV
jgi:hypothetical protein